MQSSLKNSLYLGLAVLSLGAVTAVSTSANAASKASIKSDVTMKTAAETRNVESTGTNALYSKPGTVKGAKVVASKTTMKKLADSKKSADYFRAYRVAVTSKGSVYYKVVTMNGKYRGYIYGGKSTDTFAGGIKTAATTTKATLPTRTTGFHLVNAKKNTLWTAPQNTQYKAKKVSMYGVKDTDTFKVSDAATKTREGSLYYYVTDEQNSAISGWIFAGTGYSATATTFGGLSTSSAEAAATNDNSVKVVYQNNGSQVGTATWITTRTDTKAGSTVGSDTTKDVNAAKQTLSSFASSSVPAGFQLTNATVSTTNATYGNTLYVDVTAAATSKVSLSVESVDNAGVSITSPLTTGTLNSSEASVALSAAGIKALSGTKGATISQDNLGVIASGFSTTFKGTKNYYAANGDAYHYEFTFNPTNFKSDNRVKTYGDTLTASFTAKAVKGAASTNTVDNSWLA
ncbi:S-layer protein [Levilactobacillus enshiensis]|uniref:S-layer protein n=1 Tax=Levilactobacillus enshiensis TaxID=2590213 RepID=UPI00117999CE|nr:S-layer protein [Levilactobacillus enshiensis]